jgi:hypothetical protein
MGGVCRATDSLDRILYPRVDLYDAVRVVRASMKNKWWENELVTAAGKAFASNFSSCSTISTSTLQPRDGRASSEIPVSCNARVEADRPWAVEV